MSKHIGDLKVGSCLMLVISDVVTRQMRQVRLMQVSCVRLPVTQPSLRYWHAGVLPTERGLAGLHQMQSGRVVSHPAGAQMLVCSLLEGDMWDRTMYCVCLLCPSADTEMLVCCLQEGDSLDCKGPIPKLPYKANMKKHIGMVRDQHSGNICMAPGGPAAQQQPQATSLSGACCSACLGALACVDSWLQHKIECQGSAFHPWKRVQRWPGFNIWHCCSPWHASSVVAVDVRICCQPAHTLSSKEAVVQVLHCTDPFISKAMP